MELEGGNHKVFYAIKNNLNLLIVGFGCCKQEIYATRGPLYDIQRFGISFVNLPEDADVLVIQGFFNEKGIQRILEIYERMTMPRWVICVGKCVLSSTFPGKKAGFREGNLLEKITSRVKVDVFVPGCPPRPEAFLYSILRLMDKIG
ncbi:MAG: NADH-quinone oxidoreductase subunit B [Actinobacteria bacterium]|nr:NADH-quinone oxidoreductase subunit B [Actinomycetota bacterium]